MTRLLKAAVAPIRLPAEFMIALPDVVGELPGAVRDLRAVLAALARLTESDGELTVLLREAAGLAARRERQEAAAAPRPERRRERTQSHSGSSRRGP